MPYDYPVAFYASLDDDHIAEVPEGLEPYIEAAEQTKSILKFGNGSSKLTGQYLGWENDSALFSRGDSSYGTASWWMRTNYNGNPSANMQWFFLIVNATALTRNRIRMRHSTTGKWLVQVFDDAGVVKVNNEVTWSPTSGEWYHFELDWDGINGSTKLFVDGQEQWENVTTFTRSDASYPGKIVALGQAVGSENIWVDDVWVIEDVLHTSNFVTPTSAGPPSTPDPVEGIPYLSGQFFFEKSVLQFLEGSIDSVYENGKSITGQFFFEKVKTGYLGAEVELTFERGIDIPGSMDLVRMKSPFLNGFFYPKVSTKMPYVSGLVDVTYMGAFHITGEMILEKTGVNFINGQITCEKTTAGFLPGLIDLVNQRTNFMSVTMNKEKLTSEFLSGYLAIIRQLSPLLSGSIDAVYQNSIFMSGKLTLVTYIPRPHNAGIYQRPDISVKEV
jgi:hypothetical protein